MTHIRGEIEKVYEVLKEGYEEPLVGGRSISPYSFAGNVGASATGFFDITDLILTRPFLIHSINISSYAVAIQRVYLILYPAGTVLGDFYFRYDSTIQFFLGDVLVDLSGGGYVRIYLENNVAAIRYFEGSVWYKSL